MHEIPFCFICVGVDEVDVFSKDDYQLACTFADAIGEFIRLEQIFARIADSRKVVVMQEETQLLEELKELVSRLEQGEQEHDAH